MDDKHPTTPHWYLPWLAVPPALQGGGLGSSLLAECLADIDASGLPAYLETPNPRTVPLYERHGFAVTGVAQVGESPPITLMLRGARELKARESLAPTTAPRHSFRAAVPG